MLELKQLTKIYQTKGGSETKALDGVSVSFGETGLVFLLGKSGSGKSTMLNLAGGLDEPTGGEIVVMGKSSQNFSESDFDSYRNTFVGFVFQEYNVLDEFTVKENVALALELQGKTKSDDKVRKILEEVELGEFAKRKPNTLSGGQKQRVAIARALVKEPRIILADEPTGALDSETGKQIFETLKKLSQTRLVIVVSHDREFAETYGDRIIELKDGRIVSDVSRTDGVVSPAEKPEEISPEEMFAKVSAFLRSGEGETYEDFLRATRTVGSSAFAPTEASTPKEYDGNETVLIRSRLSAKKALKMGVSNLKLKPFRLIMTILLSVVSFILFGLFSTIMLYDKDAVLLNSFLESNCEYLLMEKHYELRTSHGTYTQVTYPMTFFTPEEVSACGEEAIGTFDVGIMLPDNITVPYSLQSYYQSRIINRVAVLPENHVAREKLTGTYPVAADEIAVSSYFLDYAKSGIFRPSDEEGNLLDEKTVRSAEDLIGERMMLSGRSYAPVKITGVFDCGRMPEKYDVVKNYPSQNVDRVILSEYGYFREDGPYMLAYVSEAFVEKFIGESKLNRARYFDEAPQYYRSVSIAQESKEWGYTSNRFKVYRKGTEPLRRIFFIEDGIEELQDGQIILPLDGGVVSHYRALAEFNGGDAEYKTFDRAVQFLTNGSYFDAEAQEHILPTEEELEAAPEVVRQYLIARPFSVTIQVYVGNFNYRDIGTYRVVGAYVGGNENNVDGFYCSQNLYDSAMANIGTSDRDPSTTEYVREANAVYDNIIRPITGDQMLRDVLSGLDKTDPDTDIVYRLDNRIYRAVTQTNDIVDLLFVIFLWLGLALAIFAALLLFNFISMSISNKKKEIGILRAVGARGADVFKIFFAETGVIVGICIVLALLGTFLVTLFLNRFIRIGIGLPVSLFAFGAFSVVFMIVLAVAVAFVGTFLPVYLAAKKKPVESIRSL